MVLLYHIYADSNTGFSPEYLELLLKIGESFTQLRREINVIKALIVWFCYLHRVAIIFSKYIYVMRKNTEYHKTSENWGLIYMRGKGGEICVAKWVKGSQLPKMKR